MIIYLPLFETFNFYGKLSNTPQQSAIKEISWDKRRDEEAYCSS